MSDSINNIFKMTQSQIDNMSFYKNTLNEVKELSLMISTFINDNENKKNILENVHKDIQHLSTLTDDINKKLKKLSNIT
jgi:hypothetical protein